MENDSVVIGGGVVGQATGKALNIKKFFDKQKSRSNLTEEEVKNFRYLFVCVPTPSTSHGCDVSYVEEVIKNFGKEHIYIIRSTVVPGTAEKFMKKYGCQIISNPEFLTETTSEKDARHPDIIIIGASSKSLGRKIKSLFYTPKRFPESKIIITNNSTAEMIKYSVNTFYITKVIFASYLYRICQQAGIDYERVKEAMYNRKWIGNNHLTVPYENKFGVHGKCLSKDLTAFAKYSRSPFFKKMVQFMNEVNSWKA